MEEFTYGLRLHWLWQTSKLMFKLSKVRAYTLSQQGDGFGQYPALYPVGRNKMKEPQSACLVMLL